MKTLEDTAIGYILLNKTVIALELRIRIYKCNCIKLKIFCTVKQTKTKLKRQFTE
jgi:hypothetical protein